MIEKRLRSELPFMATENIIMDAVKLGKDRQQMHEQIRQMSMEAGRNVKEKGLDNNLLELVADNEEIPLSMDDLSKVTDDLLEFVGRAPLQIERFIKDVVEPVLQANKDDLGLEADIAV